MDTAKRQALRQAELAGVSALPNRIIAAVGILRRPARVECSDDVLTYDLPSDRGAAAAEAPKTLLFEFLALDSDGSPANIKAFAEQVAVLGICWEHGLPFGHQTISSYRDRLDGTVVDCHGLYEAIRNGRYEERIKDWRAWARRFRLVFDRANILKQGARSAPLLDESFLAGRTDSPSTSTIAANTALRNQLARVLNGWLADATVAPMLVTRRGERPEIQFGAYWNVDFVAFPVLVLQLLFYVTGAQEAETCSSCGRPYLPKRRASRGRDHYCPQCGRTAANRAALRRFREFRAEKKRLATHATRRRKGGKK